jgi:hypothetical protein
MFTIISAVLTMHLASLPLECPNTKQHCLSGTGGSCHLTPGGSVVTTTTTFSRINKLQTLPTQSLPVFRKTVPRASSDLFPTLISATKKQSAFCEADTNKYQISGQKKESRESRGKEAIRSNISFCSINIHKN